MTLADLKNAKKVIGIKQVNKALEKGLTKYVIVAQDADAKLLKPLLKNCQEKDVKIDTVETMKELGRLCNINVGSAAVAVLND